VTNTDVDASIGTGAAAAACRPSSRRAAATAALRRLLVLAVAALALLAVAAAPATAAKKRPDRGDFKLTYQKSAPADAKNGMTVLRTYASLRTLVKELNAGFRLPRDIRVLVGGSDGPYYDPNRRTIVMSPDFFELVLQLFRQDDPNESERTLRRMTGDVAEFVFLHEVGHALVDQLRLPITGREEDAVDDLAAVLMLEVFEEPSTALAASYMFALFGDQREALEASDFFDEHSLDEQRFYSIICHMYGSDPRAWGDLAKSVGLPASRRSRCRSDYQQTVRSWFRLLRPHLK
jgi:hypothetical protein